MGGWERGGGYFLAWFLHMRYVDIVRLSHHELLFRVIPTVCIEDVGESV